MRVLCVCVWLLHVCICSVGLDFVEAASRESWDMGHIMFVGVFLCAVSEMAADGGVTWMYISKIRIQ